MGALGSILAIALAPIVVIFTMVFLLDRYEREPIKYLIWCFVFGVLIAIPVVILETVFIDYLAISPERFPLIGTALIAGIGVALPEEGFKFLVLRLYAYPKKAFNEPFDGIMYAVAISMGFAAIENVLYTAEYGLGTGVLRMFTAVPAHGAFAHLMGYFAGMGKFHPQRSWRAGTLALGLFLAVLAHGLYDFFLMYDNAAWGLISLLVLAVALLLSFFAIRQHQRSSPFRNGGQNG